MPESKFLSTKLAIAAAIAAYSLIAAAGVALLHSWLFHVSNDASDYGLRVAACAAVSALGDDYIDKATNLKAALPKDEAENGVQRLSSFRCRSGALKRVFVAARFGDSFRYLASSATKEERASGAYPKSFDLCEESVSAMEKALETNEPVFWKEPSKDGVARSFIALSLKTRDGQRFIVCANGPGESMAPSRTDSLSLMIGAFCFLLLLGSPFLALWLCAASRKKAASSPSQLDWRQAQLIQAGRLVAMGEMTAGIAHEINQPLCVIRGYLELLQSVLANEPVLKARGLEGAFDIGIKSVDKASRIINHMRSFVRLKPGEPKAVSLKAPLEDGLSFFNEQIKLHNIQLLMSLDEDVPPVRIDQQKFEQIVVNLVSNSRYAVDEKGERLGRSFKKRIELRLRFDKAADRVVFEVEDNGSGMSRDVMENCGRLFFTTKKPGEGTGLGVSIVKEILKEFGGELKFRSVDGDGSVFSVSFPPSPKEPTGELRLP